MAFTIYTYNYKYNNGDMREPLFIKHEIDDDSTVSTTVEQSHFGTDMVAIYVDYQKGSENGLILTYDVKMSNTVPNNNKQYKISYLNSSSEIVSRQMTIPESGTYRIPVSVDLAEQSLLITFTFDGSSSFGDVEAYIRP